jgi:hypothetical protein
LGREREQAGSLRRQQDSTERIQRRKGDLEVGPGTDKRLMHVYDARAWEALSGVADS